MFCKNAPFYNYLFASVLSAAAVTVFDIFRTSTLIQNFFVLNVVCFSHLLSFKLEFFMEANNMNLAIVSSIGYVREHKQESEADDNKS